MALVLVSVITKNGDTKYAGGVVLNTAFMNEIQTEDRGAMFLYYPRPEIKQGGVDTYVVSQDKAWLKSHADTNFGVNTVALDVYIDNDPVKDTTNKVFHCPEIVRVYPDPDDRDRSWLYVNEKGRRVKRYLIENYYVDLAGICMTGTTSTTTSSTTTGTAQL